MIGFVRASVLVGVAALVACQPAASSGPAGLPGTHSLTLAGDLLFITATDGNELRVLSLSNDADAKFIPAPNPLHPLSIPVADRPTTLASDVVWSNEGSKGSGPWVYSLSANGQEVSIVGASRESLVEEKRLSLAKLTIEGSNPPVTLANSTITALAARGQNEGSSTLYLGTFDGTNGQIYQVEVKGPGALDSTTPLTAKPVVASPCGAVRSILVLPGTDRIAYSTSCTGAGGFSAYLREGATETPLRFAFPTRMLVTHPAVENLPAGGLILGVFDEQSCGGASTCRGVSAVIGAPNVPGTAKIPSCGFAVGDPACDFTGFPMPTIDVGDALVMGLEVAANAPIPGLDTPLAGIITTSDGRILFIDALRLAQKDLDDGVPTTDDFRVEGPNLPPGVAAGQTGIVSAVAQPGAARSERITVEFAPDLPGLTRIPFSPDVPGSSLLRIPTNPMNRVQVGDLVQFSGGAGCEGETTVAAFSDALGFNITVSTPPPATGTQCLLTVRPDPAGANPWVVTGSASGFMGRIAAAGGTFDWPATDDAWSFLDPNPAYNYDLRLRAYYAHPEGFGADPAAPVPPAISFGFSQPLGATPGADLALYRGLKYSFAIDSHFRPAASRIGDRVTLANTDVAGAVVYRPEGQRLYVAFPSGNLVIEAEAKNIVLGGNIDVAQDWR